MIQLSVAITSPSSSTMRRMAPLDAPIARSTPISRMRSIMLIPIVVDKPRLPTSPSSTALRIRKPTMMSNISPF